MKSAFVLAVTLSSIAVASPAVIQPPETASKDVFLYEFLPTFNFDGPPFGALLGAGKTGIGHDFRSLIQFDLTGVTLAANERATLNLYVGSTRSAGFGNDPTPATPVTDDLFALTQAWTESTATWGTQPAAGASPLASVTIDSINHYVSFDITTQVQAWLANPSTNFGLHVAQRDIVGGGQTAAVFDSSAGANRPYLEIAAVPEPTSAGVLMAGAARLLAARRRRRR